MMVEGCSLMRESMLAESILGATQIYAGCAGAGIVAAFFHHGPALVWRQEQRAGMTRAFGAFL